MTQDEFVVEIINRLCASQISYLVTGSHTGAVYGEPRHTNDVDILIDPTADQIRDFVSQFDEDFYVELKTAIDAITRRSMFNVIQTHWSWKADLIVPKHRPYTQAMMGRGVLQTICGRDLCMVSPEDAVLSKLEWAKKGGSERQLRDVTGILIAQQDHLDLEYLHKWAVELGVDDQLSNLLNQLPEQDE